MGYPSNGAGYGNRQNGNRPQYGNRQQNGGGYQNRNGNNRCTQKQAEILQKYGYNPNVSFDEASRLLDGLKRNNWQRPDGPPQQQQQGGGYQQQGGGNQQRNGNNRCTQRQADLLAKHGYDPNVSFDEASAIIDELAANNWQRPDGQQNDPSQYQGGYDNGGQFQGTYQDGNGNSAPFNGTYPQDDSY